jgi:hypothetical protein
MEFPEEGDLEFTARMVRRVKALENLVQAFKEERPKSNHRPKVTKTVGDISCVVVVRPDYALSVELTKECV